MLAETLRRRQLEFEKYNHAYLDPNYRMGARRKEIACELLNRFRSAGQDQSFLDVGAGRGEMIAFAKKIGFQDSQGTEVVPRLCAGSVFYSPAHNLAVDDNEFDVVACLDVLEHLLAEDIPQVLVELVRVSSAALIISTSSNESRMIGPGGTIANLHITIRTGDQWGALIESIADFFLVDPSVVKRSENGTHYWSITWKGKKAC